MASTDPNPHATSPAAPSPGKGELPKQYRPGEHEERIFARWQEAGAFHADPSKVDRDAPPDPAGTASKRPPYCILIPPPNVTDRLHLGHALNNSLQDILVRAHRMMGYETLWMPGTDHAGIATQAVVERRLKKDGVLKGPLKSSMPREEFIAHVQAFKDEYEAVITGQLKAMGCSCDFERQRFTMDPICARAVREAFFRLFKDGLIYRGKRLVNWDPALQTAVADDEVENIEIDGAFYYLRYPLVRRKEEGTEERRDEVQGKESETERRRDDRTEGPAFASSLRSSVPPSFLPSPSLRLSVSPVTWSELARLGYPGAEGLPADDAAYVTVATTRPETYLGDTAVAVNPHDPRAKALRGMWVELPIVGRVIPIIEDSYVVLPAREGKYGKLLNLPDHGEPEDAKAAFATGFLKVTPAHDPNDYELGQRHKLATINVMAPDASISDKHGWSDVGDAHIFVGKKREDASKLVVKEFEARGLLEDQKPYRHTVGHSDRSKAAIEPYLSDQWYVRVTDPRMAASANNALTPSQRSGAGSQATSARPGSKMPASGYSLEEGSFSLERGSSSLKEGSFSPEQGSYSPEQAGFSPEHGGFSRTPSGSAMDGGSSSRKPSGHGPEEGSHGQKSSGHGLERGSHGGKASGHGLEQGSHGRTASGHGPAQGGHGQNLPRHTAGDGSLSFHPARYAKTYEGWHDNIRDWCISRQLWWGHRIPVWSKRVHIAGANLKDLVRAGDLEFLDSGDPIPAWVGSTAGTVEDRNAGKAQFRHLASGRTFEFGDMLRGVEKDFEGEYEVSICVNNSDGLVKRLEGCGFVQDPDVLDTWFSSALWPMSTMGWPDPELAAKETGIADFPSLLPAFNPTSTLCTAREIITLWVSRMVMFNRYFLGEGQGKGPLPYRDVFIHCVVQDGEGRKMSKMLGNGLDPLDVIASHGTDALRFTVCQMSTNTQDVRLPVKKDSVTGKNTSDKFDLGRNFANKLWNAASFALRTYSVTQSSDPSLRAGTPSGPASRSIADRWMLSRLATAVVEVESALKNFEFSSYAQTMYDLLWRDFCDWYLEAIKPTVAQDASQRAVLAATLDAILRLLHPIMPYVTEAIYEQVRGLGAATPAGVTLGGASKGGLLATAAWPKVDASLRDPAAEAEFEQLRAVITAIREVRAKHNVQPKRRPTLHVPAAKLSHLRANETLVSTLAGLGTITDQAPAADSPFVDFTSEGAEYKLSDMADAVDAGAEKARLTKLVADLEKSVATFEGRLANPGYAAKAPPAMVQQTKDQMEKAKAELVAAKKGLEGLGS